MSSASETDSLSSWSQYVNDRAGNDREKNYGATRCENAGRRIVPPTSSPPPAMLRRFDSSSIFGSSSTLTVDGESHNEENADIMMLKHALRDLVRFAFGIVAVSLWIADENEILVQPDGGWLVDPVFDLERSATDDALNALEALNDPSHPDHVPAEPTMPGVGLPGILWRISTSATASKCTWIDLSMLANDPFQQPSNRLSLVARVFGKAAGFSFDIRGHRGIVIYFARGTANEHDLSSDQNLAYMRCSADLLGAISAWHSQRTDVTVASECRRKKSRQAAQRSLHQVKFQLNRNLSNTALAALARKRTASAYGTNKDLEIDLEGGCFVGEQATFRKVYSRRFLAARDLSIRALSTANHTLAKLRKATFHRATIWSHKWKGGELKPPPAVNTQQSLIAAVGTFISIFVVSVISEIMKALSGGKYQVILPAFGAFASLQYSLTAAPAAQPRNAVLGNALSLGVACFCNKLSLPTWLCLPTVCALSIGSMSRLGVVHPPAAAAALAFVFFDAKLAHFFLNMLAVVVSVLLATAFNNIFYNRQYPTCWGWETSFLLEYPGLLSYWNTKTNATQSKRPVTY